MDLIKKWIARRAFNLFCGCNGWKPTNITIFHSTQIPPVILHAIVQACVLSKMTDTIKTGTEKEFTVH